MGGEGGRRGRCDDYELPQLFFGQSIVHSLYSKAVRGQPG